MTHGSCTQPIATEAGSARSFLFSLFDLHVKLISSFVYDSGAECTEAGLFAIRERRKMATEKDFLMAVEKVIKSNAEFSATSKYMLYN